MEEVIKIAVPILAVVIPCIGVYWTFRKEMVKHANPTVGQPGLIAIGGALSSQEGAKLYIEEIRALTNVIAKLADAQIRTACATELQAELMKQMPDDVMRVRKKLGEHLENEARMIRLFTEAIDGMARLAIRLERNAS